MSHQTGIKAGADLKRFMGIAKCGNVRMMKVSIKNEELVLSDQRPPHGHFEADYDSFILPCLHNEEPCYILYRMDTKNNQGFQWLFIAYTPDFAKVRDKMLYAGTRATLKIEFGDGHILEEISATHPDDAALSGYRKHIESKNAAAPLSDAERELKEVKRLEHNEAGVDSKCITLPGLNFPISSEVVMKLDAIKSKKISYLQLKIDIDKEEIHLQRSEVNLAASQLEAACPANAPRYHLYLFKHKYEGASVDSMIFIYSIPGYASTVKERMLYSSCKGTLISYCEEIIKMRIDKKLEISDYKELNEEFLMEEIHPKKVPQRPRFEKPKPPPGRGTQKRTKPSDK